MDRLGGKIHQNQGSLTNACFHAITHLHVLSCMHLNLGDSLHMQIV